MLLCSLLLLYYFLPSTQSDVLRIDVHPMLEMLIEEWSQGFNLSVQVTPGHQLVVVGPADSVLDEPETHWTFPVAADALVFAYHLPTHNKPLNFSLSFLLAKGDKRWDDVSMRRVNPGVPLPSEKMIRISLQSRDFPTKLLLDFGSAEFIAVTSYGVGELVHAMPNSAGWLLQSTLKTSNRPWSFHTGLVGEEEFTSPDSASFSAVLTQRRWTIVGAKYPGFLLLLAKMRKPETAADCQERVLPLKAFFKKAINGEQKTFLPLPDLLKIETERILEKIKTKCSGLGLDSATGEINAALLFYLGGTLLLLILLVLLGRCIVKRQQKGSMKKTQWLIAESEILFGDKVELIRSDAMLQNARTPLPPTSSASSQSSAINEESIEAPESRRTSMIQSKIGFFNVCLAHFGGKSVLLYESGTLRNPGSFSSATVKQIQFYLNGVTHENLWKFRGITTRSPSSFHIFNVGTKGSLHGLLAFSRYELGNDIKRHLAIDLCEGLRYLHSLGIVHGFLDSWNCVLDPKWTVKISNWAQLKVAESEEDFNTLSTTRPFLSRLTDENHLQRLLFRHSDFLSGSVQGRGAEQRHDLYSLGMVLLEIFTRELPFSESHPQMTWKEIVLKVAKTALPPQIPPTVPPPMRELILEELVVDRPKITASDAVKKLRGMGENRGIVDILMVAMEDYMAQLEEKVEERTGELRTVSQRMEELLLKMLPAEVANKLQLGQAIEPEYFESVTIYFSDIVSFTSLCSESTPLQVITMLNALYTLFDGIIQQYNVYKVETIGDAYMCVSGLPQRTGPEHAAVVTKMSLAVLAGTEKFVVPHKPDRKLQIRVGIHSGSVMAGVVGSAMPRYCLFGDTVNVASRMESNSLPNRIHVSEDTAAILKRDFPEFLLEERGHIELKGKGVSHTFWVLGLKQ